MTNVPNDPGRTKRGRPCTGTVLFEGGRYKARISIPTRHGGVVRKVFDLPEWYSLDEARAKAAEMANAARIRGVDFIDNIDIPKSETTSQWWKRYLAWKEARGDATIVDARGRFTNWIEPEIGTIEIRMVKDADIERVVHKLDAAMRADTISWRTAKNVWGEVKAAFKNSHKSKEASLRVRHDDPSRDVPGPDRGVDKEKPVLYPDEVVALLACEAVPLNRRRGYAVAIYTGGRSSELAALRASDLNFVHARVVIAKQVSRKKGDDKRTKTKRARSFDIEAALVPLLCVLVAEKPEGRLLHLPPSEDRAELLRKDLKTAGVVREELHIGDVALGIADDPMRHRVTFHNLRDTHLTWMAVRGDDAMKIQFRGGHMDMTTTLGYVAAGRNLGAGFGTPFPALPTAVLKRVSAGILAGKKGERPRNTLFRSLSVVTPTGIEPVLPA